MVIEQGGEVGDLTLPRPPLEVSEEVEEAGASGWISDPLRRLSHADRKTSRTPWRHTNT